MQKNYNYRKFSFSNTKGNLFGALNAILAHISENLEDSNDSNNIIARSKWILTELLTNAAKHTNEDLIDFEICFDQSVLVITKLDCGEPFSIFIDSERKTFPVDFIKNKRYVIQKDDLSILSAIVSCKGELIFEAEDVEIIEDKMQKINEHFGLIIIARSSDKFIYTYDECTKTNVFKVGFNL